MEHSKGQPDPRLAAIPDSHGHAKGEHKPFAEERPIPYTARMLFLWFFHACRRGAPRFLMVADHMNYLTFEDPAAVNLVRRALKLAQAGDLYGAAETAEVELGHAAVVSEGLRRGMRYSIGAEVDNDPRSRPDAQNIVDAMRPDGMVRSVHFLAITHPQHGENWMWPFDNPEFKDLFEVVGVELTWELYMATLLDAIDKLPGNIVGHFYVPAIFGHWPDEATLERYEDQLVDACAERGFAIEVNTRYFYKHFAEDEEHRAKYRAVMLRLLKKAVAKNVAISVGSDAHSPKDQGAGFDEVLELLDEAEINEIAFPVNGRIARVALRATEEVLRAAGVLPVEPPPPPEPERPPPPPVPTAKQLRAQAAAEKAEAKRIAAEEKRAAALAKVEAKRQATEERIAAKKAEAEAKAEARQAAALAKAEADKARAIAKKQADKEKAAFAKQRAAARKLAEKQRIALARERAIAKKQAAREKVQLARERLRAKKLAAAEKLAAKKAAAAKKKAAAKARPAKKAAPKKPLRAKKAAPKKKAPAKKAKAAPAKRKAVPRKPAPKKKAATSRTHPRRPAKKPRRPSR